jgi:hypothetical protein
LYLPSVYTYTFCMHGLICIADEAFLGGLVVLMKTQIVG